MRTGGLRLFITATLSSLLCAGVVFASSGIGLEVEPPKPIVSSRFVDEDGNKVRFPATGRKWKIVFFGYTRCPDVCPMTMEKVSTVLKDIRRNSASQLEVVFVTIDGARDKPADLKAYLRNFGPDIKGLIGDARSTQKLQQQFGVITRKFQGKTAMAYTLEHSIFLYLLDPANNLRYMFSAGSNTGDIVKHIDKLLVQGSPGKEPVALAPR